MINFRYDGWSGWLCLAARGNGFDTRRGDRRMGGQFGWRGGL